MTESSWHYGPEIVGDRVYDVLGRRLGDVVAIDAAHDALDVKLTQRMARKLAVERLRVPLADVVDADDHDVTLDEEAELLAHPERRVASGI